MWVNIVIHWHIKWQKNKQTTKLTNKHPRQNINRNFKLKLAKNFRFKKKKREQE